ncbi:hypothetical protein OIU79_003732 [Salix purpurea]|uniref:Uncharacterized protein n=2 Tax=Salix TaxID=40685 RepID=A0A9Q0WLI3_9ROSI|nr:hypothetical protein OIU79_003732 [Salix purpurea]KAJ6725414.1 hypothetical protein OIU79_003732 [Salix purpurea]KAJ6769505.1 hypothetical protein OIU74_023036 [Salix koriyanagi]KAJ6769506.1 hypothetical protein OIU74_023036 [Salix koriyanagi]
MAPGILDGFLFVVCGTAFCFPWMLFCIMIWENLDDCFSLKSADSSPFHFFGLIVCKIWDSLLI